MTEFTYWPKRVLFYLIAKSVRIYMAILLWGKKKSVPPVRNKLLLKSATQLANEIREGKLKSEEIVQTYIARIEEVEPYINAVVQDNFDGAIREAKKVDALIESGKFTIKYLKKEKPLLGVPFTVKCLLKVKGFQDTGASLLFKDRIAEIDAPPVVQLKHAGGIFLALTNSAEFGSANETCNNIYGQSCNPYDVTKTSGGSSGGEAALISAAGAIIGLGNDCFGSVRIPAFYCGVLAHKPTRNLISSIGNFTEMLPVVQDYYSVGPMCRFSEDLFLMMKVLAENYTKINSPREVDFKNLKIFYQTKVENAWIYDTDKEIVQAVQNAALHFKRKFEAEVKEINIQNLSKTNAIILNSLNSRVPNVLESTTNGKVKNFNGIVEWIKMLFGKCEFTLPVLLASCFAKWPMFYNKNFIPISDRLQDELTKEFENLLDDYSLFIFPTAPKTAPYHYETIVQLPSVCFTAPFNMLGMPATQCPLGFDKNGLPLGVQITGRKGNDLLTLLAAKELEKAFGGWTPP